MAVGTEHRYWSRLHPPPNPCKISPSTMESCFTISLCRLLRTPRGSVPCPDSSDDRLKCLDGRLTKKVCSHTAGDFVSCSIGGCSATRFLVRERTKRETLGAH